MRVCEHQHTIPYHSMFTNYISIVWALLITVMGIRLQFTAFNCRTDSFMKKLSQCDNFLVKSSSPSLSPITHGSSSSSSSPSSLSNTNTNTTVISIAPPTVWPMAHYRSQPTRVWTPLASSLTRSVFLNLRLVFSANYLLRRPFPFLPDWFYGLSDHLMFLFCSTAGFVYTLC